MSLSSLQPEPLWRHFEQICSIPHPSGQEQTLVAAIVRFAGERSLHWAMDAAGNLVVRKGATAGMEQAPGVILQTHLDMVAQKNEATSHDFATDAIKPQIVGEWVTAQGTTLGADNGIGVAAALAVLERSDVVHGPLEALFTVREEIGLLGAGALQPGMLGGTVLINLDTEDEDELIIGCAGAREVRARLTPSFEEGAPAAHGLRISVGGLRGGHSGLDIDRGRANALKLLARVVGELQMSVTLQVASLSGGNARNAIPREAWADVVVAAAALPAFEAALQRTAAALRLTYATADEGLVIGTTSIPVPSRVWTQHFTKRVLGLVQGCVNGVIRMSDVSAGVVESSSNLALVRSGEQEVVVECLVRSLRDSEREDCVRSVVGVMELAGATVERGGAYPGWQPNSDSRVVRQVAQTYERLFGKQPHIQVVHAGLECGVLGAAYPALDMVSMGPTIRFPHSPDERVEIASVGRFWTLLCETLKGLV